MGTKCQSLPVGRLRSPTVARLPRLRLPRLRRDRRRRGRRRRGNDAKIDFSATFTERLDNNGFRLMKRIFILMAGFLSLPYMARADSSTLAEEESASVKAEDFVFSGYSEAGRRSQAEDFVEEDTDEDYSYQNYHLKFERAPLQVHAKGRAVASSDLLVTGQRVSQRLTPLETLKRLENKTRSLSGLSYDVSSFVYHKDYKTRDSLDNISRIFKAGLAYDLKRFEQELIRFDFKLKVRQKRYQNNPASEYDEIGAAPALTFEEKDNYRVDLTLGVDNFNYLAEGEKDQFKTLAGMGTKKHFLEKRLTMVSSYKIEQLEQKKANHKKTKQEAGGGFDYEFGLPWIHKHVSRLSWGQRDTKDEEERDEDIDFEYWQYYLKSEHRINPKLKTHLKYQYFAKDYINTDLDHWGFYIRNALDYELLDDQRQRLWLDFAVEHKEVKYNLKPGNDYQKETLEAKISYKRKKNWHSSIGLEDNFYDFSAKDNDKNRSYLKLSAEKLFQGGDLALSADFKYRFTDYAQKEDQEEGALRLGFKYRF